MIKHISLISTILSHSYLEDIMNYLNVSYWDACNVVSDLTVDVYRILEVKLDTLEPVDYLEAVTRQTKSILWTKYNINLYAVNGVGEEEHN